MTVKWTKKMQAALDKMVKDLQETKKLLRQKLRSVKQTAS